MTKTPLAAVYLLAALVCERFFKVFVSTNS